MDEKILEALEHCIQALETGADVESVLKRYPDQADELRPLLQGVAQARSLAGDPSEAAIRRGRAKVLQRAAEMRESAHAPRKSFMPTLMRFGVSLAIALVFLLSGTGLVRASSASIPGDNLYPIKRTWESMRLAIEFSPEKREALESEFEQERLHEIEELFARGREANLSFLGRVTVQEGDLWLVSDVPVKLLDTTTMPKNLVEVGDMVMVTGQTRPEGQVEATIIELLTPKVTGPVQRPTLQATPISSRPPGSDVSEGETGLAPGEQIEFTGIVIWQGDDTWIIAGRGVDIRVAEIKGKIVVGSRVKVEGYYLHGGTFVATRIELISSVDESPGSSGNGNGNFNGDDDNDNSNDDSNDNDNDNDNDNKDNGNDNKNDNDD